MTRRQKFFAAMRRQAGGFVPFEFSLCPSLQEKFKQLTGRDDYWNYYDFPHRNVSVPCLADAQRFERYFPDRANLTITPDFGVGLRAGGFEHFNHMEPSLAAAASADDFAAYPYPDAARDWDWSALPAEIAAHRGNDLVTVANMEMTIFEIAWYIRGMETFMTDMLEEPELAAYHLDRLTAIRVEMARRYAAAGADVLRLGDDVATQIDMMISTDTWREILKPRLAQVINAARAAKPDILIFYHGDGNMVKIFNDLIEIGVDILNPIQPECMDPVQVKAEYGDRASLWGCLGTQTTMPFGTPADVRAKCRELIDKVAVGGGLFLAPSHLLEPEVPWANVEAFVETVREHNG